MIDVVLCRLVTCLNLGLHVFVTAISFSSQILATTQATAFVIAVVYYPIGYRGIKSRHDWVYALSFASVDGFKYL